MNEETWRNPIPNLADQLEQLAGEYEKTASLTDCTVYQQSVADALRSAARLIRGMKYFTEKEERQAWDMYAAHSFERIHFDMARAAHRADELLEERRKRFPRKDTP